MGAGLLIKSFVNLMNVDPGFNPDSVLTVNVVPPRVRYPDANRLSAFYDQLLERVKTTPGVQSAAAVSSLPLGGNDSDVSFWIEGRPIPRPDENSVAWYSSVTTDYFSTMRMRLVKGRLFNDRDNRDSTRVLIINETMARRYWPDEDPIGKRITSDDSDKPEWSEVVGVVADVKHFGLSAEARPSMYLPLSQAPARSMFLTIRTTSDPMSFVAAVRSQVSGLDKDLAVSNIATMNEIVSRSVAQPRFVLLLLGLFAGLALVLAAVGIYGVMSYSVTQRTHEIGIRVALGASSKDVVRLVVGQGMGLAVAGVAIGVMASLALTRVMESLLYGVSATDPVTYVVISLMLGVVAVMASVIPARRASKVDPMIALRCE
jgi:putative ABC transport system permease protein